MPQQPLPEVDPREVGDALLVDVREDDEWAAGHAPDAVHLPLHELSGRLAELPRDRPLAVVCRVGSRSAAATAFLLSHGFAARNVSGGMLAWAARGLPLAAEPGRPHVL